MIIAALQERAARALPAEFGERVDGWWLRAAPSCSWWVGTTLPHGDGSLADRVDGAEKFYRRYGIDARIQISPGASPSGLDELLAGRGYRRGGRLSLQTAATASVLARSTAGRSPEVRVDDAPSREWFAVWHEIHGQDGEWELLGRVDRPSAYASVVVGGDVVAVGRAVADDGWAGLFGMATLPAARGRGAAGAILDALAGWAVEQRAGNMYLQVEAGNGAATRLYGRAGFREICAYHYRSEV
ncbi:GNAT family N-acetyltransferase [Actinoplanes sp. HUAS TT8]|uniref:GNAT family N-acetyltransferase n=1 Tax=Actinoplanes sp. HUAS TT8 TaxID=3447453 RepID=UPI003F521E52